MKFYGYLRNSFFKQKTSPTNPPVEIKTQPLETDEKPLDGQAAAWKQNAEAFINNKYAQVIEHGYAALTSDIKYSQIPNEINKIFKEIVLVENKGKQLLLEFKQLRTPTNSELQEVRKQLKANTDDIGAQKRFINYLNGITLETWGKITNLIENPSNLNINAIKDCRRALQGAHTLFRDLLFQKLNFLENELQIIDQVANYKTKLPAAGKLGMVEPKHRLFLIEKVLEQLNQKYKNAQENGQFSHLPRIKTRAYEIIRHYVKDLEPLQRNTLRTIVRNDHFFIREYQSYTFFASITHGDTDTWCKLDNLLRDPPRSSCEKFCRFIGF